MSGRVSTDVARAARPDGRPSGLRQLVGTSRPLSWINTAYPFAAAYLLAGGGVDVTFVVGTLFFLIPYNLLMYGINDVYDHESDVANPRKGGIEGVVLDVRWHRTVIVWSVATTVPFVVALVVLALLADEPWAVVVLAVSVAAVVAYSAPHLRFKERPGLDSATSATHFVSPAVLGVVLAGGPLTWPVVATLLAFFAWACASHAFGAVQDVRADRGAGIASIATVLGARRTVRLAMGGYALAAVLMLTVGLPASLAAVVPVAYLVSIAPYRNLTDDECERANRGWRRFLWLNLAAGFAITQGLIIAAIG
jgi:4-hydroxybenzoate polyprenyltransferase